MSDASATVDRRVNWTTFVDVLAVLLARIVLGSNELSELKACVSLCTVTVQ